MKVARPQVDAIRRELQVWLSEPANDKNENLPTSFGCDYNSRSEGLTERQRVSQLVAEFERLLHNQTDVLPQSVASHSEERKPGRVSLGCDGSVKCHERDRVIKEVERWPLEK